MNTKTILLCSVALTLGACSSNAGMYESSGPKYTPRAEVSQENYTTANRAQNSRDREAYNEYEQREPCQNYRRLPRNMADDCVKQEHKALPIVSSYTVLFNHDGADLRQNEIKTIEKAMREINRYNPRQVTVTGYTDSTGKADYNQNLSKKREQAVSQALLDRGVQNQTVDRKARGEYTQAVQTKDGVRNQANRRVVIDFRR